MTTAAIRFNPMVTTNAAGSFSVESDGLYQGTALDSPNARYNLAGGSLSNSETIPMWGGIAIYENIPNTPGYSVLGGTVGRAATLAAITGFSVFDQAHAGLTTPQSPVPLFGSDMSVNFYRLGSGQRIAVKAAPSLSANDGESILTQVSWDFVGQQLVPYAPAYNAVTITGAVYSAGQITYTVGTDLTAVLSAGDVIAVSGVVSTGASTGGYNGEWVVVSTTSTTVVVTGPATTPGTYSSGGTIAAGGGALPVKVLQIQTTNCKTVDYDTVTGFATWNPNGSCAIILI